MSQLSSLFAMLSGQAPSVPGGGMDTGRNGMAGVYAPGMRYPDPAQRATPAQARALGSTWAGYGQEDEARAQDANNMRIMAAQQQGAQPAPAAPAGGIFGGREALIRALDPNAR